MSSSKLVTWLLSAGAALTAASSSDIINIDLATKAPPSSSPIISKDFQSFSIEFSSWEDYAGKTSIVPLPAFHNADSPGNKSHPNTFSNTLFSNLREFNGGIPQILRIGGNTQYDFLIA